MPLMRQSELEARAGADSVARAIGGRVRQGRNSRGWTLDQLAGRSGVSRRMLVSIEQGAVVGPQPEHGGVDMGAGEELLKQARIRHR